MQGVTPSTGTGISVVYSRFSRHNRQAASESHSMRKSGTWQEARNREKGTKYISKQQEKKEWRSRERADYISIVDANERVLLLIRQTNRAACERRRGEERRISQARLFSQSSCLITALQRKARNVAQCRTENRARP